MFSRGDRSVCFANFFPSQERLTGISKVPLLYNAFRYLAVFCSKTCFLYHLTDWLVQLLRTRYRCERSGVRFPGGQIGTMSPRLATVATLLRNRVAVALSRKD